MRTTKEEREYLRAKYSRAKDYDDVRRDVLYLLDDANTAEYLAAQLQHVGLDAADDVRAVPAIALAAGLGADATAEEVAAQVGEMRGKIAKVDARLARIVDAEDALEFARELGWPRA